MVIRLTCWLHSIRNSMKRVVIFLSLLFRSHQAYDAVRRMQNTIFVSRFQPYGRITEAYAIRPISREILIMEGNLSLIVALVITHRRSLCSCRTAPDLNEDTHIAYTYEIQERRPRKEINSLDNLEMATFWEDCTSIGIVSLAAPGGLISTVGKAMHALQT